MSSNDPSGNNTSPPDFGDESDISNGGKETDAVETWPGIRRMYADSDEETRAARQKAVNRLCDTLGLVSVRETGELYRYDEDTGIYRDDGEELVREKLEDGLGKFNSKREANGVIYKLEQRNRVGLDEFGPAGRVCVKNGVLDVTDPEVPTLESHSPDRYFLRHRPVEYDPGAECPRFEQFVAEAVPDGHVQKLQEFVGYTVFHHWGVPFQKALLILGPEATGKSTFLDTITALLGEENLANQSFRRLAQNNFAAAQLRGNLANIYNDLDSQCVNHIGLFKNIVGGDPLDVEEKYKPSYSFRPTQKLLFAANQVPDVKETDGAFYRRWLHVEFPYTVPDEEQDKQLDKKLEGELPGILNWALDGYRRLMANGGFTNEKSREGKRAFWKTNGDTVERFVEQGPVELNLEAEVPKDTVYAEYEHWCAEQELPAKTKPVFSRKLTGKYADVEVSRPSLGGERVRCYQGITPVRPDADGNGGGSI